MRLDLRKGNIGVAVMFVILAVGCYLFRHAGEGALQLVGLIAFAAGLGTAGLLFELEDRRNRRQ
jgi:hypothetical protein